MPVKSRHAFPVLLSSLALCITIAAVFSSGCGGSKPGDIPNASAKPASGTTAKRLIFLTNGDDPFWDACNAGLIEGSKRFDIGAQGLSVVMEKIMEQHRDRSKNSDSLPVNRMLLALPSL